MTHRAATDLLGDLQAGTLRAVDLMARTLDRVAAVDPAVNAIVSLRDRDALMAEAAAKDREASRGPLHGLPIAIKDLAAAAGLPATSGSPLLADHVPDRDEIMVTRLRAAGAIVIGKTNVPEFGLGSHTINPVHGATRNPYDTGLSAGGSSGGAAVALATGMLALADGSDMMGSLRNPAAWNNVYGLRPSWGLVPSEPEGDSFLHQLSTLGPMARSPADLALMLAVMAGPDPRQPHGTAAPPDLHPLSEVVPEGLRIGWLGDWGGAYPMEPGLMPLAEAALAELAGLGAEIVPLAPPFPAEALWESWTDLRSWQLAMGLAPHLESGRAQLKQSVIWEIERGLALSAAQVHAASVIRSDWFKAAAALFEGCDALVLPCTQVWPFPVEQEYPTEIAGTAMDTYHRWMEVMIPAGLIGLPALAMPAGFGANGLPAGIQLIGPRGSDARLLGIGAAYEAATGWPSRRPPRI